MKRIITCSDGTWNRPGSKDRGTIVQTNVEKMFNAICHTDNGISQLKVYDQGVGTGFSLFDRLFGGAAGKGIDKNIKDMYIFLMLNYQKGDEIYLFGFSRGAYTARSVVGLIRTCGLLKAENMHLVDKAYELYRDRNDYSGANSDLMISFRKNHCVEDLTPIKFIGVWDTVGALGIPLPLYYQSNKNRYKFHDVNLSKIVEHAYQALAIDEQRHLFEPAIWKVSKTEEESPERPQYIEQRWFTGVHSNVGGGYYDCGLSDLALEWLIKKAKVAGLCYHDDQLTSIKGNAMGELRNSITPLYWFPFPKRRKIDPGNPLTNEVIDDSVWQRYDTDRKYRPGNLRNISR
ncbi:MAG: DUF2235 domain-containing protein [Sphingobacteriaceae bacterium]